MNCLWYSFACSCGATCNCVRAGVTSLGELVVTWICNKCKAPVMVRINLEQVIRDIPSHPGQDFTEADKKLLAEMNIRTE